MNKEHGYESSDALASAQDSDTKKSPDLQGEGNYDAAKQYDKDQAAFVKSGAVERANPEPQSAAEAEELRKAEAEGRSHAKGEDPKIKRGGSTDKA